MSGAEDLRIICSLQQVPAYAPGALTLSLRICRELGLTISALPALSDTDLSRTLGLNANQVRAFRAGCSAPLRIFESYISRGIRVSTVLDEESPPWSSRLLTTPWLYYTGNMEILSFPAMGFSGSRDASEEAIRVTEALARTAVREGMTVVSGGARGVDMAAHREALEAGGTTAVIVPQGLATWWASGSLADPVFEDQLLVLSTDLPSAGWLTASAMQRNRAIVDLADIIVIPQAGTSGGSFSTGQYALGKKRHLWVADLGDGYAGNHELLRRGASPIPFEGDTPDLARMRAAAPTRSSQQPLF